MLKNHRLFFNCFFALFMGLIGQCVYAESSVTDSFGQITAISEGSATWNPVGTGISQGMANGNRLVLDSHGTPFIVYVDTDSKTYVMKFDRTKNKWESVGNPILGNVNSYQQLIELGIDSEDTLYLSSYRSDSPTRQLIVMKFDPLTNQWLQLGSTTSPKNLLNLSNMVFSTDNIPYIVYGSVDSHKLNFHIIRFDSAKNEWVKLESHFSTASGTGRTKCLSLAMDTQNNPYLAFCDEETTTDTGKKIINGASFVKYDTARHGWTYLGTRAFSGVPINGISLVIDAEGIPYVAYSYEARNGNNTHNYISVMKFNYTTYKWRYHGMNGSQIGNATSNGYYPKLAINHQTNLLYLGFNDVLNGTGAHAVSVMIFDLNQSNWIYLGSSRFAKIGGHSFESLALYDNVPFVSFLSSEQNNKTMVMSYS